MVIWIHWCCCKLSHFWCLWSNCQRQCFRNWLTQNLHRPKSLCNEYRNNIKYNNTCAARSTRIFEKEFRWMCSYLSFGTIAKPDALPLSCSYSAVKWLHDISFPFRYKMKINLRLTTFILYTATVYTQREWHFADQQLPIRVVLIRCGVSENRKRSRPSSE